MKIINHIGCSDPDDTQDDDECYCNECSMGEDKNECVDFRLEYRLKLIFR